MAEGLDDNPVVHEAVREKFPAYPNGINHSDAIDLLDETEAGIVHYSGRYSPAIKAGIIALRGIRDDLTSEDLNHARLRYCVWQLDFQLKNNLHRINLGEV
jgi:hypothetical protein